MCASDGGFVRELDNITFGMTGIDIDGAGNILVSDSSSGQIVTLNPTTGAELGRFGAFGSADGQLTNPIGVGNDSAGNIWVGDQSNFRMQKFNAAGTFLLKSSGDFSASGPF